MSSVKQISRYHKLKLWFKRFGIAGIVFFLLKGIAWLVAVYFIVK